MDCLRIGKTRIWDKEKTIIIEHCGNLGTTIERVNNNLFLLGYPTIQELKANHKLVFENGSPDYFYEIIFKKKLDKN
jgi:hypothetical protein